MRYVRKDGVRGEPLAAPLGPVSDDYFVLKPKHSAFFGTSLELLLGHCGARTLVIGGLAGNNCVIASAIDASMRGYTIIVLPEAIASEHHELNAAALAHMRNVLKAATSRQPMLIMWRSAANRSSPGAGSILADRFLPLARSYTAGNTVPVTSPKPTR